MMSYNIFRSRTTWTLIVMFVGDALSVYGHVLSPELLGLFNLVLSSLANYFHIEGVKNAALASAKMGTVQSGQ